MYKYIAKEGMKGKQWRDQLINKCAQHYSLKVLEEMKDFLKV